ncbi:LPS export ABC transporter permease LptG [Desulfuromonas thiophila]|uniref:LPS export ABC transporter permease LptG n=1 Tax=Desulfuromonas thiophila TaxID=57664 RepID=UPI0029F5781E|nr:LPS export ABC transporter permease LptG [Desulfuromonas thiophila]
MTLIQRYLLSLFARATGLALAAFAGIYLLIDFFEKVDDFLEHQARLPLYLAYFASKLPLIIAQLFPLALLLGVFLTLGQLARSQELTAMRAGGIGLKRLLAPLLLATVLLAGGHFALSEYLVPGGVKQANFILQVEVKGKSATPTQRENLWLRSPTSLCHIQLALPEQARLQGLTLFLVDDQLRLHERIDATSASFVAGQWLASGVVSRRFDPASGGLLDERLLDQLMLSIDYQPADFAVENAKTDELDLASLRRLSHKIAAQGLDAGRYQVDFHSRLAAPFTCLIMALLAIPFALQKSRNLHLALGISISILIGAGYFVLHSTLLALGYAGRLPPLVSAWAANLIFLTLAGLLILSTRD